MEASDTKQAEGRQLEPESELIGSDHPETEHTPVDAAPSDAVPTDAVPEPSIEASPEEGGASEVEEVIEEILSDDVVQDMCRTAKTHKDQGNGLFRQGEFGDAIEAYTQAIEAAPPAKYMDAAEMAVFYSNRAACQLKLEAHQLCIDDCDEAIKLNPSYAKAYGRRAKALEALERYDQALEDFKKLLELEPNQPEARAAVVRLPPLVEQQKEKMKEEMFGKLKELGNMCLRPFGLSTNNFQFQQDPNSGSYSVNFVQNPAAANQQ